MIYSFLPAAKLLFHSPLVENAYRLPLANVVLPSLMFGFLIMQLPTSANTPAKVRYHQPHQLNLAEHSTYLDTIKSRNFVDENSI
jgi:hypothetical protein